MVEWPEWWGWELEFSPHLLKRMIDRSFNEADLRLMLAEATGYHKNHEEGALGRNNLPNWTALGNHCRTLPRRRCSGGDNCIPCGLTEFEQ